MSRTTNGNLTGRAAHTELTELRDQIQAVYDKKNAQKHAQLMDICQEISDVLGTEEYFKWVDSTPALNFWNHAADKLLELKSLAFQIKEEIEADNEWPAVGQLHNTAEHVKIVPNRFGSVRYPVAENTTIDVSKDFGGLKITATKIWVERHLNR
jgi:hypothetical protein